MKKISLKKKVIGLVTAITLLAGAGVYAETQTGTLTYKDLTANYKLDVNWSLLNNDNAIAETKFVNPDNINNVAVRLEMWKTSSSMTDFKYQKSKTWAQATYSWPGVYEYKSRHSIDNSDSSQELVVRTLTDW